jgi:hypothetical protein
MTKPQFTIPQVEDALAPYIQTREKTTRIRQILTQHLKRHVQDDSGITHLSLSVPPSSLQSSDTPLPIDGSYKQYLEAVKAHRLAHVRYDTIKDELNLLLRRNPEGDRTDQASRSTASVREYTDLLRQRGQQRKLEIVQDALTKLLETEPNPAQTDVKASVKEELGEPPQPPVANLEGAGDADSRVEDLTFQLKKELLVAKNKFSEVKTAKEQAQNLAQSGSEIDAQKKISILRDARDELITWLEGELAKIPEDEVEASQAEISFIAEDDSDTNGSHEQLSNEDLSKRVEDLYNEYLASRQRYITEVEATLERMQRLERASNTGTSAAMQSPHRPTLQASHAKSTSIQASQLLPYLIAITSAARDEALLQQQTSHLRRQLTLASEETDSIVQRLAGESLLVPQNSTSVSAWAKAASEGGDKTKQAVLQQLIDGEASVSNAKKVLDGLRARKRALEGLKRDL